MYWAGLFPRKYSQTSQEKQKWPSREKILPPPLFKVVAAWIKQPKDPTPQENQRQKHVYRNTSSSNYFRCTANCTEITIADAGENSGTIADFTQHFFLKKIS